MERWTKGNTGKIHVVDDVDVDLGTNGGTVPGAWGGIECVGIHGTFPCFPVASLRPLMSATRGKSFDLPRPTPLLHILLFLCKTPALSENRACKYIPTI